MNCDEARNELPALAQGSLGQERRMAIEAHISSCQSCAKDWTAAKAVWSSLDMLTEVPTPHSLRERLSSQIVSLLDAEARAGIGIHKLLGALLSGIVLALLGIWSLNKQVNLETFTTAGISGCAVLWAGLFIATSCLIMGRFRLGGTAMSPVASTALASTGMVLLGTYFCPKLELLRFWLASLPGEALAAAGGMGLSHFAFGCLYATVPTFLAALYFGSRLKGPWLKEGLWTAAGFILLLSPSLYVQCSFLPMAMGVFLIAGVFVGSLGGALAALRLQHTLLRAA